MIGALPGVIAEHKGRIPEEKSKLTSRIHALTVKQIDRILAVIARMIVLKNVMTGRIPEVIGGKMALIADKTAARITMAAI